MPIRNKILLIDTNYPINSRNQRIVDSLSYSVGSENIRVVAWEREEGKNIHSDSEYIYSHSSPLGDRWAKLKALWGYRNFIKKVIDSYNPKIIIASHWDSLLLASTIKKINQVLIYENLDMPSGNGLIRFILNLLERYALRNTDAITYASHFYLPFYQHFKGKHIILENKLARNTIREIPTQDRDCSEPVKVMFNGAVRYPETMLNLFEAIGNNSNIDILIYGYPSGKDGELILEKAKKYNNIKYIGPYNYNEIPNLYSKVDLVWGVYPAKDFNVKYAISNKFHESIAYGIPGIYAAGTKLGDMVVAMGIGFTVDGYSVESIRNLFDKLLDPDKKALCNVKNNLLKLRRETHLDWDSEFQSFKDYILTIS